LFLDVEGYFFTLHPKHPENQKINIESLNSHNEGCGVGGVLVLVEVAMGFSKVGSSFDYYLETVERGVEFLQRKGFVLWVTKSDTDILIFKILFVLADLAVSLLFASTGYFLNEFVVWLLRDDPKTSSCVHHHIITHKQINLPDLQLFNLSQQIVLWFKAEPGIPGRLPLFPLWADLKEPLLPVKAGGKSMLSVFVLLEERIKDVLLVVGRQTHDRPFFCLLVDSVADPNAPEVRSEIDVWTFCESDVVVDDVSVDLSHLEVVHNELAELRTSGTLLLAYILFISLSSTSSYTFYLATGKTLDRVVLHLFLSPQALQAIGTRQQS
jgi:hypothetical protein